MLCVSDLGDVARQLKCKHTVVPVVNRQHTHVNVLSNYSHKVALPEVITHCMAAAFWLNVTTSTCTCMLTSFTSLMEHVSPVGIVYK